MVGPEACEPGGRRASRAKRVNYAALDDGPPELEQNADPNAAEPGPGSRRSKPAGRQRAADLYPAEPQQQGKQQEGQAAEQEQQQQGSLAGAPAGGRSGKRKPAASAAAGDGGGEEWVPDEEGGGPGAAAQAARQKQKRQRVLVDVHGAAGPAAQDPEDAENDFERARLERIRRNQEVLAQMGIRQMASDLVTTCHQPAAGAGGSMRPSRPKERRERAPALPLEPARKSARMLGLEPGSARAAEGGQQAAQLAAEATDKEIEHVELLELEEYFKLQGQDVSGALAVDGRYHGWVSPAICERYGVAGNADEAWESNGGGKFTFKIDKKAIPANLRNKGWSDARAFAATQLQKNPNAYFYRHVAPHEQQAQGEWTEEEHALFLATARANGVGDKWGLFASHIPQRVGYQCSAYYRDVIIPSGLIIDKRFKMTRGGKAVYVG